MDVAPHNLGRCDFGISRVGRPFIAGHRGASARYPENTILSMEQAIADGAEIIEFDVQLTLDNEIVIMHDPSLERTTTGKGMVSDKNYFGDIEFLTTKKEPHCPIARFQDVLDLLFKPENSHVWAVIDVKINNPFNILATLSEILKSRNEYSSVFSKRITLGLWHPKFVSFAKIHLPEIPIIHIGVSLEIARDYFSEVDGYNLKYVALSGDNGNFIKEAHAKGKPVFVWTVNKEVHAKICHNWGADAIMTDKTKFFVDFFKDLKNENGQEGYNKNSSIIERKKFLEVSEERWYIGLLHYGWRFLAHWISKWKLYSREQKTI